MAHFPRRGVRWISLISTLLFVLGIGLMLYPLVGTYLSGLTQSQAIDGYLSDVASESAQQMQEQIQEAMSYNTDLLNSSAIMTDPFSVEAFENAISGYNEILEINDTGIMGYLDIPSISVHLPIYHGTGTFALQHGVGHLETTSFPVGGESTHAVLTAHSGLTNATMFDDLPDVQIGDTFSVTVLMQTIYYEVYEIETVLPEQTESLYIQLDRDLITLVTCTPYGINTHRLLVHGERIDAPESEGAGQGQELTKRNEHDISLKTNIILMIAVGMLILCLTIFLIFILGRSVYRKMRNCGQKKE